MHSVHRQQLLQAMGITPYCLKPVRTHAHATATTVAASAAGTMPDCVLVAPLPLVQRQQALLQQALTSVGSDWQQISLVDAQQADMPQASVFIALGDTASAALAHHLSAAQMQAAHISLLPEPAALHSVNGKRKLWQAMRHLRRHKKA